MWTNVDKVEDDWGIQDGCFFDYSAFDYALFDIPHIEAEWAAQSLNTDGFIKQDKQVDGFIKQDKQVDGWS